MGTDAIDVVIIGSGQAGLAMSYHLTVQGRPHLVLEQGRIAETWRSKRWDSLCLVVPNREVTLPGFPYQGDEPDGFMSKDAVVAHLEAYAHSFGAPVREHLLVTAVEQDPARAGFLVRTEGPRYAAAQVVLATGALQRPRVPDWAAALPAWVTQIVPTAYRNPGMVPPGAVLVVGSGETGCQIAEEVRRAGRAVYLSVGRSWWIPRRYRGREIMDWFTALGWFDRTVDSLPAGARRGIPGPQLTGSEGGRDLNVHTLAGEGVVLVGRVVGVDDGKLTLAGNLAQNLAWGDAQARTSLQAIDQHIREQGLAAPEEGIPSYVYPVEALAHAAPTELDLADAGIGTVIWATGYRPDLGWIRLPFLDAEGYPIQRRGVTGVPGLSILGLDWLYSAKSALFGGVGEDAGHLAAVIMTHQS